MKKFQNILSLSPNYCGPSRDTKTSIFFPHSFSRCNSGWSLDCSYSIAKKNWKQEKKNGTNFDLITDSLIEKY